MADPIALTLHALATESVSGVGSSVDTGELRSAVELRVSVTAASGAGSIKLQTSADDVNWRDAQGFGSFSAARSARFSVDQLERFIRVSFTVGTALTFALTGESHVLYATREDVTLSEIPQSAIESIDTDTWADSLIKASVAAEDAIATSHKMPLTNWPASVREACAAIAALRIMRRRGFRPQGHDDLIVTASEDAKRWLRRVATGELKPPGLLPKDNLGVHASSGNVRTPQTFVKKFSSNWGDFH